MKIFVSDVDNRITKILDDLLNRDFSVFKINRAILYYLENEGLSLEPLVSRPEIEYPKLQSISAAPNHSSFVANRSFNEDPYICSKDPKSDPRWGTQAKKIMTEYGITGSIFAFRLSPTSGKNDYLNFTPLGVLILCTERAIPSTYPEKEFEHSIATELHRLGFLLALRESTLAVNAANSHEKVTNAIFDQMRPIPPPSPIIERFKTACQEHLRSSSVLLDIVYHSDSSSDNTQLDDISLKLYNKELADTLRKSFPISDSNSIILNRPHRHKYIFDCLSKTKTNQKLVWAGVRIRRSGFDTICFLSRDAKKTVDHWTDHDLLYLERSINLLHIVLKRSLGFSTLLNQMQNNKKTKIDNEIDLGNSLFNFFYYICQEYLGVDQLLITKVQRESTSYKIKGVHAKGFDEKDVWLVENTNRTLTQTDYGSNKKKIDIMPHILREFLFCNSENDLPTFYSAKINDPNADFIVDPTVIDECKLKGSIYYLPCYIINRDGLPRLQSILHLSDSSGTLKLSKAFTPLLKIMAKSVADALAENQRRRREDILRQIRKLEHPSAKALNQMVRGVKDICHSIGATIFLQLESVYLLGWPEINDLHVEAAFAHLLKIISEDRLSPALDDNEISTLKSMIRECLGLTTPEFNRLLRKRNSFKDVAPLLSQSVYVRVACTQYQVKSDSLKKAMASFNIYKTTDDESFLNKFAKYILKECYLAGYGLTGWVLRYRQKLLIPDKKKTTIKDYFQSNIQNFVQPELEHIVRGLSDWFIKTKLVDNTFLEPMHHSHICDKSEISDENDPYLACPMEEVKDARFPVGVIRTSTSTGIRSSFEIEDLETVDEIARQLSRILRHEFARQGQIAAQYSSVKGFSRWAKHNRKDFTTAIEHIKNNYANNAKVDTEVVHKAIRDLETFEKQINVFGRQDRIVREICRLQIDDAKLSKLMKFIKDVIMLSGPSIPCTYICTSENKQLNYSNRYREIILGICFVVNELVSNSSRHADPKPSSLNIILGCEKGYEIQIIEDINNNKKYNSLEEIPESDCSPYLSTVQGEGLGSRMIRNIANTIDFKVLRYIRSDGTSIYIVRSSPIA